VPAPPTPAAVCGDGQRDSGERCDDGNAVDGDGCSRQCQIEPPRRVEVPVKTIESLRVSGEAHILPPPSVQSQMQRGGRDRVDALFRVCLDATGQVGDVTLRKSTGFADYDARLASGVRGWRYRPYSVDGRAVAVCGSVRFVYVQR
jgi:cysteine-rich repeat protein